MSCPLLTRAQVHYIRQLRGKKYRLQVQAFLVEGKKSVGDLLCSDYRTELVVATPGFLLAEEEMFRGHSFPIYSVAADFLARMSSLQTNHEVLAVARMKPNVPLGVSAGERALVLDRIKDPGNLGTIMRIADWYGIRKLICSRNTVDRYNTKVIQASMGSFTQVQSYYTDLGRFLEGTKLPVIGAVVEGKSYLDSIVLPEEGLLVIGNESQGIGLGLRSWLTLEVAIRRHGRADSLNAAIATAILCERWCNVL